MLTNATVKAARARARPYKMGDAGGLYLFVRPSGRRTFRMKYRHAGQEKLLTFGDFPDLGVAEARDRRDQAREQLRRGIDPAAEAASARAASSGTVPELHKGATFEELARGWHERRRPRWSDVHAADVLASLEREVFPVVGDMQICTIDAPTVLRLLLGIEARGCVETARRLRQRISAVFRYAISIQQTTSDPAGMIRDELSPAAVQRRHPALLNIDDARALLEAVDALDASAIAKLASRFLALTGVRMAAVRGAGWDELEDVDLDGSFVGPLRPTWRVPAARMKVRKARKLDPDAAHLVPLAPAAIDVLRAAHHLGRGGNMIFPGRGGQRPIGEAAIGDLYVRAGYAGRHVPHGWRASFSTILNKRFPQDRALIDRALAHAPKDKVEAAYNRAGHAERQRVLFYAWAELLEG